MTKNASDKTIGSSKSMSVAGAVRIIGDVITELDVLRANFDRETEKRRKLDNIRDDLDAAQRKLVRSQIKDNSPGFQGASEKLKSNNTALRQVIDDVNKFADTLESLVKFLEAAQKIAELAP